MFVSEIVTKAQAEEGERLRAASRRASVVRLDDEVWARLDRIALELGWSRNRLIAELVDEASTDLAAIMSRDEEGNTDASMFEWLVNGE